MLQQSAIDTYFFFCEIETIQTDSRNKYQHDYNTSDTAG